MTVRPSDPAEKACPEAAEVLRRLAGNGAATPRPRPADAVAPLPPRSAVLPAWSEKNFRDLVEALPDGVVVIDAAGTIVLVNREAERLFGYPRDELLGQAIEALVPERFREVHVAHRDGYMAAPRTRPLGGVNMELFGRRKDGSEFPVEISLSPMPAAAGLLVAGVIRDVTQRKRYEAKFRTLVEHIPAVTFIAPMDDSTPELYVSPQIEHLLGFSQKEWLEDPVLWHRQLHPDDRERWNRHFAPTCAEGTPFRATYRFLAKDGHVVWVHGSANVVRDDEGKLLFLQGVAFDVTPIKEAEAERERFFSLSLDLFCVAGLDGYFKRVNQAFTAVLGHSAERLLGRPFIELVHPNDREATLAQLAALARGVPIERFENRYRCRDGSYRWLQWVATPSAEGQLCYAAARDVTREKQDEEALREEARLAALRADISAAITRADSLDGMLGRCVDALTRDLEAASAHVWTLDETRNVLEPGAGTGTPVPLGQGAVGQVAARREARSDDGSAVYPLLVEDRLLGVLAVDTGRPVSPAALRTLEGIAAQVSLGIKRKQAEDALLRANAELERRVEERTEEMRKYSYHATHDLKEPLRTILVQTQKVLRQPGDGLDDEARGRLQKVVDGVGRMQVLLNRLRDYAQVNLDASPEPIDCREAVARACAGLEAALEESKAEVDVADGLPSVVGLREPLELLFQNLIGNALKYRAADRPARVEVGARPHADGWLFWVRDNGQGIDPRYWHKIFQIGTRLDTKASGWGYGLAICEKTVARHGGRIWVASEPGQGTTFYFTLPEQLPPQRGAAAGQA